MSSRFFLVCLPSCYIAGGIYTVMCLTARPLWVTGLENRERGMQMLLKSCRCGKLIPQSMQMCEECKRRQQSRHMTYNNTRRDERAAEFYVSKEWRAMRERIIEVYDNVDIYALYVEHELLTCNPVHHIVELEDDWEQRLNPFNLIPLNHKTHNTITALYKQSKASMRATQKQLRSLIEYHFREAGGYKKVLSDSFLVAPPLLFGENSPREFQ